MIGEGAADGGTLLAALIGTSVFPKCGRALLGRCRRVYLCLLAEASRLLCLQRHRRVLRETGESFGHHLLTSLSSGLLLCLACEGSALASVPRQGWLVLLVMVEFGLALDVADMDVALVLDVVTWLLRLQVGRYKLTGGSRFGLVAQEALRVVELRGVVELVLAIVEVAARLLEVPVEMGRVLCVDWRVHNRVVRRQALRMHRVIDLRKTTRRR